MANNTTALFIKDIFKIAKTLVIKHSDIALVINQELVTKGYVVDWDNPYSWKYYKNLAGEYHQYDLDYTANINNGNEYMVIKIAGVTGPVNANFTKSLINPLSGDVSLANEYEFNTKYYNDLVNTYPELETLILGILNPIDINDAVEAENGALLYCGNYYRKKITSGLGERFSFVKRNEVGLNDPKLIEEQETSLLPSLEKWVKAFLTRWYLRDFFLIEDVYLHTVLSNMFSAIPAFIFNHRLSKCFTEEVHSFHIKSFLESHGKLGKYINSLPLKQLMFLYRNVRWIEKNTGKEETFKLLVDNLATLSGVPLTSYKLKHNLANQPEEYYPLPLLQREVINFIQTGSRFTTFSIHQMLNKEKDLALSNAEDIDNRTEKAIYKLQRSLDSEFPTKIIESDMIDKTNSHPYKLFDMLFNLWIYAVSENLYTANIFVTNPRTSDKIVLNPLNALILAIYCINKGYAGTAPINVPDMVARNIPKVLGSDLSYLLTKVESSRINLSKINELVGVNKTVDTVITSSDLFFAKGKELHMQFIDRYNFIAKHSFAKTHAQLRRIMGKLYYLEKNCVLNTGNTTYQNWLNDNGFVLDEFTKEDLINLGMELINKTTDYSVNSQKEKAELQEAVIEIMKQFSSYSVQYIYDINPANTILVNTNNLRPDNVVSKLRAKAKFPFNLNNVRNVYFRPNSVINPVSITPNYVP